jgi:Uma2 family endonuclease
MEMDTAFRSEEQFTQAEFFEWLQKRPRADINHYELLGRHIVMTPPAGYPHSPIAVNLVIAIAKHVRAASLGVVNESSAGYELPSGDTVEPDVSFVSADRLAHGPRPEHGKFYRLVPDLVVEIVSRTTARRDMKEKRDIYEKNGVLEYWLVHPDSRHVSVMSLVHAKFTKPLHIAAGDVESTALPGLRIPLETIFADCD